MLIDKSIGPEYMQSFAENSEVIETFRKTALSKTFVPRGNIIYYVYDLFSDLFTTDIAPPQSERALDVLSVHPISFRSGNPCDYRNP